MKKLLSILLAASILLMFAGCGANKLSDQFNEQDVTAAAEQVVTLLNEGNYQGVTDITRSDLQDELSADVLENALSGILESAGSFQSFSKTTVVGSEDNTTGEDYGLAIVVAEYENGKLTYTITVDQNLQIVGLYVK